MATLVVLSFILFFPSCGDDDYSTYSYKDPTIYSSSDKVNLSEVVLFISPYIEDGGQKKYIVMNKLSNLNLRLNKRDWKLSDSYDLDTLHLTGKETLGQYRVTSQKIKYPFVVNVRISPEEMNTAGEYADLLNNYFSLPPGSYVCQIVSFDIQEISGTDKTVYTPTLSCPLEVKENYASASLGEFEIAVQ